MFARVVVATLIAGLLTVASAPLHAEQDPPRIKRKADTPPSDFTMPTVPFADYSASIVADPAVKNRSAVSPSGLNALDAQKQTPTPFLGLSLKRSLN